MFHAARVVSCFRVAGPCSWRVMRPLWSCPAPSCPRLAGVLSRSDYMIAPLHLLVKCFCIINSRLFVIDCTLPMMLAIYAPVRRSDWPVPMGDMAGAIRAQSSLRPPKK